MRRLLGCLLSKTKAPWLAEGWPQALFGCQAKILSKAISEGIYQGTWEEGEKSER